MGNKYPNEVTVGEVIALLKQLDPNYPVTKFELEKDLETGKNTLTLTLVGWSEVLKMTRDPGKELLTGVSKQ